MSVGLAIKKAMERAREHERLSTRRLRVRVTTYHGDYEDGLTIRAVIAVKTGAELSAQMDAGVRHIEWEELDARCDELVGLVDEVVAEVEQAIGLQAKD